MTHCKEIWTRGFWWLKYLHTSRKAIWCIQGLDWIYEDSCFQLDSGPRTLKTLFSRHSYMLSWIFQSWECLLVPWASDLILWNLLPRLFCYSFFPLARIVLEMALREICHFSLSLKVNNVCSANKIVLDKPYIIIWATKITQSNYRPYQKTHK